MDCEDVVTTAKTKSRALGFRYRGLSIFSFMWHLLFLWPCVADAAAYELRVSASAERGSPSPLEGATVSGAIYVFSSPTTDVARVSFYMNDPAVTGVAVQVENNAPYDFAGGTVSTANPFPTTHLPDGTHRITAVIEQNDRGISIVTATFVVANRTSAEPTTPKEPTSGIMLAWRTSSTVSEMPPTALEGAQVAGNVYVFLTPETGVDRVRFYLDDPSITRAPAQTENQAPFDFAGGSVTHANAFDTRQLSDGPHTITAAVDLTTGSTQVIHAAFTVANTVATNPGSGRTHVDIVGDQFYLNGTVTYPGAFAEGRLLNVRMVNSVFEDTNRADFDPDTNSDEFIAAMPSYVANGVRAFSVSLQGGNPGYEGARNTAINGDGSLRQSYLDRTARVIRAADAEDAIVILQIYYQRQDQYVNDNTAVKAGVVNVCNWIAAEGFTNILLEIANEYPHTGFDHSIINTHAGMVTLINLAKAHCPASVKVSTSGYGYGYVGYSSNELTVIAASDYLTIHFNSVSISEYDDRIAALAIYGKPIIVNEDPKGGSSGASAAEVTVKHGASWGYFNRANQNYPFSFRGIDDDPIVYDILRRLAVP